jgi:tRNA-binding protein
MMKNMIEFSDFQKIDIRVGVIVKAEVFETAKKPAYIIYVDFGSDIGVKKSSAQITGNYSPSDLIHKQIMAVVNFPPRQIGPIMSEVLILGVTDANGGIVLISPEQNVPLGQIMH